MITKRVHKIKINTKNFLGALDDSFHPKTFFQYWLPIIAWAVFIFAISSMPQLPIGLPNILDAFFKKIGHLFEFFVLAFLIWRAFHWCYKFSSRDSMALAAVFSIPYAAFDEIHQFFVPGRHCRFSDFLIDVLGVLLFWILIRRFDHKKAKSSIK